MCRHLIISPSIFSYDSDSMHEHPNELTAETTAMAA